jgi:hypothetical protein
LAVFPRPDDLFAVLAERVLLSAFALFEADFTFGADLDEPLFFADAVFPVGDFGCAVRALPSDFVALLSAVFKTAPAAPATAPAAAAANTSPARSVALSTNELTTLELLFFRFGSAFFELPLLDVALRAAFRVGIYFLLFKADGCEAETPLLNLNNPKAEFGQLLYQ